MTRHPFSNDDIREIRDHGLTLQEVQRQLDLFEMPPPYLSLSRPCMAGDGITVIDHERRQLFTDTFEVEALKRDCRKFVPASGAASRMFKTLLRYSAQGKEVVRDAILGQAQAGEKDAQELLAFMEGIRDFAFFKELKSTIHQIGYDMGNLLDRGEFTDIIGALLSEKGLNYANLPKGLLKFHHYPEGNRTAFEEHLVEASAYVRDENGHSHLHFTVSEEHLERFKRFLEEVTPHYEGKYRVSLDVTFSTQKKSTDTIAVDLDNRPFRHENNRLLFRPGGHGALIENLNDLKGDIIFIKNIDNVVPDRLKPETFRWKKIMGGYLISLQKEIFAHMERLASGVTDERVLDKAMTFVKEELSLSIPISIESAPPETRKAFLRERLDRPIRVCGMVRNVDEPGGGPFWVKDPTGEVSRQIVEAAQIDPDSREQRAILASSTHFNPVDLVCGLRDWKGRPFDLRRYVDPNAVLISHKSKDGRDLKALEHPGLWNGAMAQWISIFVEVPRITFNPVKTINDLLRKEHQPE